MLKYINLLHLNNLLKADYNFKKKTKHLHETRKTVN